MNSDSRLGVQDVKLKEALAGVFQAEWQTAEEGGGEGREGLVLAVMEEGWVEARP